VAAIRAEAAREGAASDVQVVDLTGSLPTPG
jgi:hypothetical protein